jgi:hypothetical protein
MSSGQQAWAEEREERAYDLLIKSTTETIESIKLDVDKYLKLQNAFNDFHKISDNIPMTVRQREDVTQMIDTFKLLLKFKR